MPHIIVATDFILVEVAMFDFNDLPDIMYFGSSKQITELKIRVFLTPHKGLASLFIIR